MSESRQAAAWAALLAAVRDYLQRGETPWRRHARSVWGRPPVHRVILED